MQWKKRKLGCLLNNQLNKLIDAWESDGQDHFWDQHNDKTLHQAWQYFMDMKLKYPKTYSALHEIMLEESQKNIGIHF